MARVFQFWQHNKVPQKQLVINDYTSFFAWFISRLQNHWVATTLKILYGIICVLIPFGILHVDGCALSLTLWTGKAMSTWIHTPGKSNPKWAPINRPAQELWALLRSCIKTGKCHNDMDDRYTCAHTRTYTHYTQHSCTQTDGHYISLQPQNFSCQPRS